MNGRGYLLDTNIVVYALKGIDSIRSYFEMDSYLSVITEIEILGVEGISQKELRVRQSAIDYRTVIPLTNSIKSEAIRLRQLYKVKVPDAIIAATAMMEDYTLVTADKGFKRFKDLQLVLVSM